MSSPDYRLVVKGFANLTTYAPGDITVELENFKNLGWAYYVNDVPELFFTINQDDPKASQLATYASDGGIYELYRNGELVHAGLLLESNETEEDVIFYGYSWACVLYWLHTDWNQSWTGAQLNTIFSDLLTRATTTLSDSLASWWSSGTIQAPVTTSDGSTALTLPSYKAYRKRILLVLRELVAVAASDTTNRVWFEITPDGTYNLWKDKGNDITDFRFEYPGLVTAFQRLRIPAHKRNVLYAVGSSPNSVTLQSTQESATDRNEIGRREEAIYLEWVRDQTELDRVAKARLRRARRTESHTRLNLRRNAIEPYPTAAAPYSLMDTVPVKIDRGVTSMTNSFLIVGQEVLFVDGEERVSPLIQDKPI